MKTTPPLAKAARFALAACVAVLAQLAHAQPTSVGPLDEPQNGPRITDPGKHIIIGGTVHLASGETIPAEQGPAIYIDRGTITRIVPDTRMADIDTIGYRVWTLDEDAHIYPGFIDPWVEVDAPEHDANRPGRHWNQRITPNRDVLEGDGLDDDTGKALRQLGFVAAGIAPKGGIMRGLGAVTSTAPRPESASAKDPSIYRRHAFHTYDFYRGGWGLPLTTPTSQMGCIALIRQTISDAQWQSLRRQADPSMPINAIDTLTTLDAPIFFNLDHEQEAMQADEVLSTFAEPRDIVLIGTGTELRRLDAITELGDALILPLRFPRKPDVSTVGKAESVELETMMIWEQAPTNVRRMHDAGNTVALTTSKSRDRSAFFDNIHTAIEHGLDPADALDMITSTPARLLGVEDQLGSIEPGFAANLVIASGDLFDPEADDAEIRDVWIEGSRYEISPDKETPFDGSWTLSVGPENDPFFTMPFTVDGENVTIIEDDADHEEPTETEARNVHLDDTTISFLVDDSESDTGGAYILSGILSGGRISGSGISPNDDTFVWTATRRADQPDTEDEEPADDEQNDTDKEDDTPETLPGYPFGPYAEPHIPEQQTVLFTNATIWTSGPAGIIENGSLLIQDGRIAAIAGADNPILLPSGGITIDLAGKHITPGIVDAHSHTGTWTFGTNEGAQAVTAEVRMGDTNDPDSINWYRQLAAGVTTVNTLHGSANPIGGQNVIQKVRWGAVRPRDTHLEGAMPGIKFALGENVIHANWGNEAKDRYPQTRMGVDALMRDRFTAARRYAKDWTAWLAHHDQAPESFGMDGDVAASLERAASFTGDIPEIDTLPRRDYELDTLAEILAGDRLIHCHSYRQDEILMLASIAEDFGFTIGSYQHGLEAYKVAEAVRQFSRGASIFSDWWAYKVEVQDAIPQGGPIMWETGVTVSYNSDSDNMVRRLNTEAAKAMKYGNVPPEEALKFVTINPAIQLGIESRVGSIEVGKDADLAIWSGDPMSTFSQCEQTWIDGRQYFSLQHDREHRAQIAAERARLIAKINGKPDDDSDEDADNDDSDSDEQPTHPELARLKARNMNLWLLGIKPEEAKPGDCGTIHTGDHK